MTWNTHRPEDFEHQRIICFTSCLFGEGWVSRLRYILWEDARACTPPSISGSVLAKRLGSAPWKDTKSHWTNTNPPNLRPHITIFSETGFSRRFLRWHLTLLFFPKVSSFGWREYWRWTCLCFASQLGTLLTSAEARLPLEDSESLQSHWSLRCSWQRTGDAGWA